jgi:hypothetical protein
MGFFTNRFVETSSADYVGRAAVDSLRAEGRLNPLNDPGDPPQVFFEEIEEVSPVDVPAVVQGLTFFPDEELDD